jgi:peptidoglycan-associated lipoprotein
MTKLLRFSVMLVATLGFAMLPCAGQAAKAVSSDNAAAAGTFDLGLTYTYKLAKLSSTTGWFFGVQGASVDGVYWLGPKAYNLGLAFDLNGETATNIRPNVNLSQISFVAGPRYTLWQYKAPGRLSGINVYGQGLVGFVNAFNSVFPTGTAVTTGASSFALQTGGGVNMPLNNKWGLRLFEADYVYTRLPNSSSNYQGDIRFSGGVTYHF